MLKLLIRKINMNKKFYAIAYDSGEVELLK